MGNQSAQGEKSRPPAVEFLGAVCMCTAMTYYLTRML